MKDPGKHPPQLMLRFFRWFCHSGIRDSIEGDLMELYHEKVKERGKKRADLNFVLDVLLLFRPGIINPDSAYTTTSLAMYKNYFTVAVRNLLKYKAFSAINIFGLALAMSVCMLIILMVTDQKRYDAFHSDGDRIYRIRSGVAEGRNLYATTPYPLASALKAEFPFIEESTSLTPAVGGDAQYNQKVADMRGYFAEPSFFKIFSFDLASGDKRTALSGPNKMVISQDMARRLFGEDNPLGKVIEFTDRQLPFPQRHDGKGSPPVSWGSFTVTGVIDEKQYASHLKFDVLVSSDSRETLYAEKKLEDMGNNWEWYFRTYTFVRLDAKATENDLSNALNQLVQVKYADLKSEHVKGFYLSSQKLSDIQMSLSGNDTSERLPMLAYYFLGILAGIIMLSACLNYTNLSVARALTRAKEIGVRKVNGANRNSIVLQFLSESIITAVLALVIASVLMLFIKPAFKNLWLNKYLNFELPESFTVYLLFFGFAVLVGLLAGAYPALKLSNYQPVKALKDLRMAQPGKLGIRKVLTVSQFVISLFFITTSILIFNQFRHFMEFDYGFNSGNVVNVELQGHSYQKVANEFNAVPGVSMTSACDLLPGAGGNNGIALKKAGSNDDYFHGDIVNTDENFIRNLGIRLVAGKNLPPAESANRFILINEEAARKLGYAHPSEIVGEVFETQWGNELLEVAGVVENFRHKLLINSHDVGALIMRNDPKAFEYVNVKIASPDVASTIAKLEDKWKAMDPVHPMRLEYYEDQLTETHQGIFDVVSILGFISFIAITIACLGLLGIATYSVERRKKEVGIRKVLGAAGAAITLLLSKDFLKMLAIAVIIATPLTWFVNNLWLQKFPNRVEFGVGTLLAGTVIMLVLGLLTIGSQTISAAKNNPVDSLKME